MPTDNITEHCLDNYNDVKIFTQKDQTIETQLRLRVYLCDPSNIEGIYCENETAKIQSFIDQVEIKVYSVSQLVEFKSIYPSIIAAQPSG